MNSYDFINLSKEIFRSYRNFKKVVRYDESNEIAIKWKERLYLMNLLNDEWYIKTSLGLKENNIVKIIEYPLLGYERVIKNIN